MKNLYTPLDEKTVRSLKLGEIVNITGPVVTGRDEVHIRALEYLDRILDGLVIVSEHYDQLGNVSHGYSPFRVFCQSSSTGVFAS